MNKRTKADHGAGKPKHGASQPEPDASSHLSQREKFIQAARELGCDDDEERFAQMVRKVAKAPVPSAAEMKAGAKTARKTKPHR